MLNFQLSQTVKGELQLFTDIHSRMYTGEESRTNRTKVNELRVTRFYYWSEGGATI